MEELHGDPDDRPSGMDPRPHLFYGWVVVAVAFITLAITFGVWYSFSVFFLPILNEFGWSRAGLSGIFSLFILSQAFAGLLAGYLQDRFGPRIVIPAGAFILSVCLALTSRAGAMWHFYVVYGIFAGASISLLGFGSHCAFIPNWFERKRGLALGIAMSGIGFGMLIVIPLAEKAITAFGWRTTYLLLAAVIFLLPGPLNAVLSRHKPSDMRLRPDGDEPKINDQKAHPSMVVKIVDPQWASQDWTLSKAARTKRLWLIGSAFFFTSYVYQGTLVHAVSAMVDMGLERETAAYYFGLLGIMGSMGKILFGYLSDRLGRERINTLATVINAAGILCLMHVQAMPGLLPLLFALFFGLGYGAGAPIFPSVAADIFLGRSFGIIFAVIVICAGMGGSLGPVISGWLRDVTGTYSASFMTALAGLSFSCLLVWLAAPRNVRRMVRLHHETSVKQRAMP